MFATLPSPAAGLSREEIADNISASRIACWLALRVTGAGGLLCVAALLAAQPWLNWNIVDPRGLHAQTVAEFGADSADADALAYAVDPGADAAALAAAAMALLDEGRIDAVEQILLPRLSRMRPPLDRDRMELLRGRVLLARGGHGLESARIFFLRLLPRGLPEVDRIGDWLLEVGLQQQDWNTVERDCQTIRRLLPRHPRANEMLGRALVKRGAPRQAAIHLQLALNTQTNAALLTVLGEASLRINEPKQASATLEEAVRLPDATGEAHLLLARALLEQDESDAAERVLRETPAARVTPALVLFHANILHARGQPAACRRALAALDARRDQATALQRREWANLLAKTAGVEEKEPGHDGDPRAD